MNNMKSQKEYRVFIRTVFGITPSRFRKPKYKQNPVQLPYRLKHSLAPRWVESDSDSGTTLSSHESDEYEDEEDEDYEDNDSEYEEESESMYETSEEEESEEGSLHPVRITKYKYKHNGVRLPRWCNSDARY